MISWGHLNLNFLTATSSKNNTIAIIANKKRGSKVFLNDVTKSLKTSIGDSRSAISEPLPRSASVSSVLVISSGVGTSKESYSLEYENTLYSVCVAIIFPFLSVKATLNEPFWALLAFFSAVGSWKDAGYNHPECVRKDKVRSFLFHRQVFLVQSFPVYPEIQF